jgi:hypothetical protein
MHKDAARALLAALDVSNMGATVCEAGKPWALRRYRSGVGLYAERNDRTGRKRTDREAKSLTRVGVSFDSFVLPTA